MKRRNFLVKSALAAAGLFSLPLIAQDDLSLQIWEDTDRILRNDLLRQAFPHIYHHRKCGHVLFYADRELDCDTETWTIAFPDGLSHRRGEMYRCHSCDEPYDFIDEDIFRREGQ